MSRTATPTTMTTTRGGSRLRSGDSSTCGMVKFLTTLCTHARLTYLRDTGGSSCINTVVEARDTVPTAIFPACCISHLGCNQPRDHRQSTNTLTCVMGHQATTMRLFDFGQHFLGGWNTVVKGCFKRMLDGTQGYTLIRDGAVWCTFMGKKEHGH
jgi:hypothetical protein